MQRSLLPAPDLRLEWGARLQRCLLTVERLGLRPVRSMLRLSPSGAHAACPCPPEGSMGPVSRELSNCPCSVVLGGGSHGGGSENPSSDRASSRDHHDVDHNASGLCPAITPNCAIITRTHAEPPGPLRVTPEDASHHPAAVYLAWPKSSDRIPVLPRLRE